MKGSWTLVLPVALALLAGACGGDSDRSALPEGLPRDFPIFADARPIDIGEFQGQVMVRFETDAPRQQVTDFYKEALAQPPWRVLDARDVVFEDESLITFRREDGAMSGTVGVVRLKDTGKTNFVVSIVPRPALTPTLPPEETPTATSQ